MRITTRLCAIFTCLTLLCTSPALAQQQADDFQTFNPRFEVFQLPGAMLGNSVQGIVQELETIDGQGTEFVITLPNQSKLKP